ncbi:MAG: divergent polysaccharide deacetylase family protein [Pseudomonadota bacterium]
MESTGVGCTAGQRLIVGLFFIFFLFGNFAVPAQSDDLVAGTPQDPGAESLPCCVQLNEEVVFFQEPQLRDQDYLSDPSISLVLESLPSGSFPIPSTVEYSVLQPLVANGSATWPMIALVIDDLGINRKAVNRILNMPAPLSLSFLTYTSDPEPLVARAREAGHEVLLHLPMEPLDARKDPGPNALKLAQTDEEMRETLAWGLSRFEGYVGVNNHMGSKFTADPIAMSIILQEIRDRGLFFLDSLTIENTGNDSIAAQIGLPFAERDVFIDHNAPGEAEIRRQLMRLEKIATDRGYAVGIGHPRAETLSVLEEWLPGLGKKGFHLVPVSTIAQRDRSVVSQLKP